LNALLYSSIHLTHFESWSMNFLPKYFFFFLLRINLYKTNRAVLDAFYISLYYFELYWWRHKTRHRRIIELRISKRLNHGLNSILPLILWRRWWCWEWRYIILMFRITVDYVCALTSTNEWDGNEIHCYNTKQMRLICRWMGNQLENSTWVDG